MDLRDRERDLLQRRGEALAKAREIVERAESESRTDDPEARKAYDTAMADVHAIDGQLDQVKQLLAEEQRHAELLAAEVPSKPSGSSTSSRSTPDEGVKIEYRGREIAFAKGTAHAAIATDEYRTQFLSYLKTGQRPAESAEVRALQVDNDTQAGYLVMPLQMQMGLIAQVDDMAKIRQYASVFQVPDAKTLGFVSRDADPADPTWVAELSIGSEDTTLAYGTRELTPHPAAQFIKVSNTLLRRSFMGIEQEVQGRLAYKMAVVQENGFMVGNGARQPLGLFVANASGIPTSRDVSTDNTTTTIEADNLIRCLYTLKEQYLPRSTWLFHRDAISQIARLKDGNGNYLLRQENNAQQPLQLLNRPVVMSEYVPNTFTTGQYVGMIGDLSYYYIADALTMSIQRLVELYAGTNQTGYLSRIETDGMPVLSEAFVRVTLA